MERDILETHALKENVDDTNDLCIDLRTCASERLKSQLVELSSPALGHLLISESSDVVEKSYR